MIRFMFDEYGDVFAVFVFARSFIRKFIGGQLRKLQNGAVLIGTDGNMGSDFIFMRNVEVAVIAAAFACFQVEEFISIRFVVEFRQAYKIGKLNAVTSLPFSSHTFVPFQSVPPKMRSPSTSLTISPVVEFNALSGLVNSSFFPW